MDYEALLAILENKRITAAQEIVQITLSAISIEQRHRRLGGDVRGQVFRQFTCLYLFLLYIGRR
ncbi:hypothetical protein D3C81_1984220 [compost metagenome]